MQTSLSSNSLLTPLEPPKERKKVGRNSLMKRLETTYVVPDYTRLSMSSGADSNQMPRSASGASLPQATQALHKDWPESDKAHVEQRRIRKMSGAAGQLAAVERMGQPTAVKRLGRSASTPAHTGLAQLAPGLNRKSGRGGGESEARGHHVAHYEGRDT